MPSAAQLPGRIENDGKTTVQIDTIKPNGADSRGRTRNRYRDSVNIHVLACATFSQIPISLNIVVPLRGHAYISKVGNRQSFDLDAQAFKVSQVDFSQTDQSPRGAVDTMAAIDGKNYLDKGGFLQKDKTINLGPDDLGKKEHYLAPSRWYRDAKIFNLEKRSLFSTKWVVASFMSRFQKEGDYLTCEMLGYNFFLIRDKAGNINAFHNVCRHRGHPITRKAFGSSAVLACKYHGWTYLPDGRLHKAREYETLPDFNRADHSLFSIHTHVTPQGFIFVNFDARSPPATSFDEQFGDDFNPNPTRADSTMIGDEWALLPQAKDDWVYDHTWTTKPFGTNFNWKIFADGFQECYHCLTGHPVTLPNNFNLADFYIRQGTGMARHYLPTKNPELGQPYITWLYPVGAIVFTPDTIFIIRVTFAGPTNTWYLSETYRKSSISKPSTEHDKWMEEEIGYWRKVEIEDIELSEQTQKGFSVGILGRGRLHSQQEHAIKWYLDKIADILVDHAELELKEGRNIDWSVPDSQREGGLDLGDKGDILCKLVGPEYEW